MNAVTVSTSRASHGVTFWLWWVAATTIGWYLGFWFGVFLPGNAGILFGVGAGVGFLQWITLQAETPRSGPGSQAQKKGAPNARPRRQGQAPRGRCLDENRQRGKRFGRAVDGA